MQSYSKMSIPIRPFMLERNAKRTPFDPFLRQSISSESLEEVIENLLIYMVHSWALVLLTALKW